MSNGLIKIKQLDPEISGYISSILGSNFASFALLFSSQSGFIGNNVLYVSGGDQTISGQKTFDLSPNVPYSGGTGQATSKLFVTNSLSGFQAQLDAFSSGRATITGNQTFTGTQTFYTFSARSGAFTSSCLVPDPTTPSGAVSLNYLQNLGLVFRTGDQQIAGNKSFILSPTVPIATGLDGAVPLRQLNSATGSLFGTLDPRISSLESASNVSGFAGVLSINGASGRNIVRGCSGINVYQDGNVTRIGMTNQTAAVKTALVQQTSLPSGTNSYYIPFTSPFATKPVVIGEVFGNASVVVLSQISGVSLSGFYVNLTQNIPSTGYSFNSIASVAEGDATSLWSRVQLNSGDQSRYVSFNFIFQGQPLVFGSIENNTPDPLIPFDVSGTTSSGFYLNLAAAAPSNNYFFNYFVTSGVGPLGINVITVKGADGPPGPGLNWKGAWTTGISYAPYDYVLSSGASFWCASGHTSNTGNNPTFSPTYWNIALSGNGPQGIQGPSGAQGLSGVGSPGPTGASGIQGVPGPTGAQGEAGILFSWRGGWNPNRNYISGDAVYLSGSSYGLTGTSASGFAQNPTNYAAWNLVVTSQPVDPTLFYPANNPSGYVSINHDHPYATGIKVGNTILTGTVGLSGIGSVELTVSGNTIFVNGLLNGGGGTGISAFRFRNYWDANNAYQSGDAVEIAETLFFYTGVSGAVGPSSNPLSLTGNWIRFGERDLTFHGTGYDQTKIYRRNDLLSHVDASGALSQLINTTWYDTPLVLSDPIDTTYNTFYDCNYNLGKNLFVISVAAKQTAHPYYGIGSALTYKLNNSAPNDSYSGVGTLVFVRGKSYYFQLNNSTEPFILTTNPTGGNFNGQVTGQVYTGANLNLLNDFSSWASYYNQQQLGVGLRSGVLVFQPNANTPDTLYYQSSSEQNVGWKIKVVDKHPWQVFVSGSQGVQGQSGVKGDPGLAFAWKGVWSSSFFYSPNDAVYYNGSSYAATQYVNNAPPSETNPAWQVVCKSGASGVSGQKGDDGLAFIWRGTWDSSATYVAKDAVYYGGSSFVANGINSNVVPASNSLLWSVVARSGAQGPSGLQGSPGLAFNWKGNYNSNVTYNSGDSVFFEGSSYGTKNTVAPNVRPPTAPWFITAQKGGSIFSWRGDFDEDTTYYDGDAVYYNGTSYATSAQVYGEYPDQGGLWFVIAAKGSDGLPGPSGVQGPTGRGINWRGTYSPSGTYNSGDAVYYNGSSYINVSGTISGYGPWLPQWNVLALQASTTQYEKSFFNKTPAVGSTLQESFSNRSATVTGYALACAAAGSTILSGQIYKMSSSNVKTVISSFVLPTGTTFNLVTIANSNLNPFDRVGYELNSVFTSASNMVLGIFGRYNE